MRPSTALFLAFEDIVPLDLVGPLQVFATTNARARAAGDTPPYRLVVASPEGGRVATAAGLELWSDRLDAIDAATVTTLVVPGRARADEAGPVAVVEWLRRHGGAVSRVCSICTGAFLLAESGLLDGRNATTHWRWTAALQRRYPQVNVTAGPIFVRDGGVWTSAGVSAGIDLALHLAEADEGRQAAMEVAKTLVVFFRRPGEQPQFSSAMRLQAQADARISGLLEWISEHLADDLSARALAARAAMSTRTFTRKFQAAFGATPARLVEELRIEAAKRHLQDPALPLKRIAKACGYASEHGLRRAFVRRVGTTPTEYRRRLRGRT